MTVVRGRGGGAAVTGGSPCSREERKGEEEEEEEGEEVERGEEKEEFTRRRGKRPQKTTRSHHESRVSVCLCVHPHNSRRAVDNSLDEPWVSPVRKSGVRRTHTPVSTSFAVSANAHSSCGGGGRCSEPAAGLPPLRRPSLHHVYPHPTRTPPEKRHDNTRSQMQEHAGSCPTDTTITNIMTNTVANATITNTDYHQPPLTARPPPALRLIPPLLSPRCLPRRPDGETPRPPRCGAQPRPPA